MSSSPKDPERRCFMKQLAAGTIGGVAALVPAAAGLAFFTHPLRQRAEASEFVRLTTLEALPSDGTPQKIPIIARHSDAWTTFPNAPIGAVYVRKTGEKEVQALNVVCPHAGCFVDFRPDRASFFCPCHNSSFNLNGSIADAKSPSPRGLDSLEVEIRNENEVWVKFQNFRTGSPLKIPLA